MLNLLSPYIQHGKYSIKYATENWNCNVYTNFHSLNSSPDINKMEQFQGHIGPFFFKYYLTNKLQNIFKTKSITSNNSNFFMKQCFNKKTSKCSRK